MHTYRTPILIIAVSMLSAAPAASQASGFLSSCADSLRTPLEVPVNALNPSSSAGLLRIERNGRNARTTFVL